MGLGPEVCDLRTENHLSLFCTVQPRVGLLVEKGLSGERDPAGLLYVCSEGRRNVGDPSKDGVLYLVPFIGGTGGRIRVQNHEDFGSLGKLQILEIEGRGARRPYSSVARHGPQESQMIEGDRWREHSIQRKTNLQWEVRHCSWKS